MTSNTSPPSGGPAATRTSVSALTIARAALTRIRRTRRNQRLRLYQGRNSAATERGVAADQATYEAAERTLPHRTRGLIIAEHELAGRIGVARDGGVDRPELRQRLNATRRALRGGDGT